MRSHATGASGVARLPASAIACATAARFALFMYCMTIEWYTTVAAPSAGSASVWPSHGTASS